MSVLQLQASIHKSTLPTIFNNIQRRQLPIMILTETGGFSMTSVNLKHMYTLASYATILHHFDFLSMCYNLLSQSV